LRCQESCDRERDARSIDFVARWIRRLASCERRLDGRSYRMISTRKKFVTAVIRLTAVVERQRRSSADSRRDRTGSIKHGRVAGQRAAGLQGARRREAAKQLAAFKGYMKTAVTVDWDAINDKPPEWNSRWNKMIER
jgi:hypothetical protein